MQVGICAEAPIFGPPLVVLENVRPGDHLSLLRARIKEMAPNMPPNFHFMRKGVVIEDDEENEDTSRVRSVLIKAWSF